jgi:phosphoribosylformylglycinamidine (FGAM) synthase PurS component
MTSAVVRLWLKVMDATALTARETMQRSLGYGRRVRNVARSEVLAFRWEENVDAPGMLGKLAENTNLLQNPNKHRYEIATGAEPLSPRGNVWVLVSTPGAGSGMESTLARHHLVGGEIPQVRRGELWELDLDAENTELVNLAEEIAITRERKKGLLANPHVEDVTVFSNPPTAEDLIRELAFEGQETVK